MIVRWDKVSSFGNGLFGRSVRYSRFVYILILGIVGTLTINGWMWCIRVTTLCWYEVRFWAVRCCMVVITLQALKREWLFLTRVIVEAYKAKGICSIVWSQCSLMSSRHILVLSQYSWSYSYCPCSLGDFQWKQRNWVIIIYHFWAISFDWYVEL